MTILDDLHAVITDYVILPTPEAADAVALWIACTHALPAFEHAPRLVIKSPEKRCGKSRLLDIIEGTSHDPLSTVNATVAAIFRSIGGEHPPTLLVDEADTIFGSKRVAEQNEEFRGLLNAGFKRGQAALRCVGPTQEPTRFETFAMTALAGIGDMPDTIQDRAVNLTMRRRTEGETVSTFRSRKDGPILEAIRDRLATWAEQAVPTLSHAEPDMPVEDRAADTWEPLIAIADYVGGDWPARARHACLVLVDSASAEDEEGSLNTRLLSDVRDVFANAHASFIATKFLIRGLKEIEDAPWGDWDFTARQLSMRLKHFGVKPRPDSAGRVRGWHLPDLADAFSRYLRQNPSEPSDTTPDLHKPSDVSRTSDTSTRQNVWNEPEEYLSGLSDWDNERSSR